MLNLEMGMNFYEGSMPQRSFYLIPSNSLHIYVYTSLCCDKLLMYTWNTFITWIHTY